MLPSEKIWPLPLAEVPRSEPPIVTVPILACVPVSLISAPCRTLEIAGVALRGEPEAPERSHGEPGERGFRAVRAGVDRAEIALDRDHAEIDAAGIDVADRRRAIAAGDARDFRGDRRPRKRCEPVNVDLLQLMPRAIESEMAEQRAAGVALGKRDGHVIAVGVIVAHDVAGDRGGRDAGFEDFERGGDGFHERNFLRGGERRQSPPEPRN
jgi:hypothetical protein